MATAGDVNGDGFSDVIVGAHQYDNGSDNEGRAYVYHGSAAGLSTTGAWTVESNRSPAQLGFSVATAGDVNGDSFSDVIVGAFQYSNGEPSEGRAFVFHGSAGGLATNAAWTGESNEDFALFGYSVATAGDVNGDGFADVIVGAPSVPDFGTDTGRAYVFHGSAMGLSTTATWIAESDQAGASFGVSVATAGDVNGDGFADGIVGAYLHDNGQSDEGRAFLYFGNGGPGRSTHPRQQRTDGTTPIAPLGQSDSDTQFRIRAILPSIYGRTRLQLEHEVKPFGALFDGLNTVTGDYLDVGDDGEVEMDELVGGLFPDKQYHWRVRVKYDLVRSPFQRNGSWVHVPLNGWNEADLRTASTPVSVPDDGAPPIAARFEILPGGPNPAIGRCEVLLALGRPARIQADVLDVSGRRVAVLVEDRTYDQGSYRLVWDGRTRSGSVAAAGTYFIRVRSDSEVRVRKAILMP